MVNKKFSEVILIICDKQKDVTRELHIYVSPFSSRKSCLVDVRAFVIRIE